MVRLATTTRSCARRHPPGTRTAFLPWASTVPSTKRSSGGCPSTAGGVALVSWSSRRTGSTRSWTRNAPPDRDAAVVEAGPGAGGLGLEPESLVPARLPDLFAGSPVLILGRYRGQPVGRLRVRAVGGAGGAFWKQCRSMCATTRRSRRPGAGAISVLEGSIRRPASVIVLCSSG